MSTPARRNGKQQACEPCRKAKIGCDHTLPYCKRCTYRGQTDHCVYHPAPMTRPNKRFVPRRPNAGTDTQSNQAKVAPQPLRTQSNSPDIETGRVDNKNRRQGYVDIPFSQLSTLGPVSQAIAWRRRPAGLFRRPYGPAEFSATFSENEARFGLEIMDLPEDDRERTNMFGVKKNTYMCIKALSNFPTEEVCERLLETLPAMYEVMFMEPLISASMSSFWGTFRQEIRDKSSKSLMRVANTLWDNGRREWKLIEIADLAAEMRWEMMGVLFAFMGMAFMSLPDSDPLFAKMGQERSNTYLVMKICVETCSRQCEIADTINELVICLRLSNWRLERLMHGDESYQLCRYQADITSAAMAIGLHLLPDTRPLGAVSEWQRRLFAAIYHIDKEHSSFNGRPPILNRRYCMLRPPLDISDEDLIDRSTSLTHKISELDANGWNQEGKFHSITAHRARYLLGPIRDECLELTYSVDATISQSLIDILPRRLDEVWKSFPAFLRYNEAKDKHDNTVDLYSKLVIWLEYLQSRFLLERLRKRHHPSVNDEIIFNIANQMIEAVTQFWVKRDQLSPFRLHFTRSIVTFGIPATGVVCLHSLQYSQTPSMHNSFPLSLIVRNLVMFIAFIEWMPSTDGNYKLCQRLKSVIQRVIDHSLQPRKATPPPPVDSTKATNRAPDGDGMAQVVASEIAGTFMNEVNGCDYMEWLNIVDWVQTNLEEGNGGMEFWQDSGIGSF